MALNIDGIHLNPIQSGYNPDLLIYRPESVLPEGLLDGGEEPAFRDTLANFAGGLLDGYQRIGDQFVPINPSGIYTGSGEPNEAGMSGSGRGDGAFTVSDLMQYQSALSDANFGDYPHQSVFTAFEDKGDGTFDLAERVPWYFQDAFDWTDAEGNTAYIDKGVFGPNHAQAGQPLDEATRNRLIISRLRGVDLSGGNDGGDAAGGENEGGESY